MCAEHLTLAKWPLKVYNIRGSSSFSITSRYNILCKSVQYSVLFCVYGQKVILIGAL